MPTAYRLLKLGISLALACAAVSDGEVWTKSEHDTPPWASDNTLQLKLSADSTNYAVIPLTKKLALGDAKKEHGSVEINGNLKAVHDTNYNDFGADTDVAYMSCDKPEDETFIDPSKMLNELMSQTPKAIILFSTCRNWCSLNYDGVLSYTSVLSMADPGEASTVLNHLNGTDKGETIDVSIYGKTTNLDPGDNPSSGHKSAVAMSILYSITGLITLLFLIIIVTGAVRAHRYPERYGPRRADDGRPSQSRAKGLARAVLETLPIKKFGDRQQAKPDPDLEMETATTEGQYAPAQNTVSGASDARFHQESRDSRVSMSGSEATGSSVPESEVREEYLGCSICTEDFKVGEDVRVLPCDHQYHPHCVDPWLINVSGTCPLCRLDLRPGHDNPGNTSTPEGGSSLPPPLAWEWGDNDTVPNSHRNRLSRLLDINRLRQATVEEQMEVLRQLREDGINREAPEFGSQETPGRPQGTETQERNQTFADKLKDRLRILTRSQSAQRQRGRE